MIEKSKSLAVILPSQMSMDNINQFSLEQIAEEVFTRLKKQQKFARDPNFGGCMYRVDGIGSPACAVGVLIPDNQYHAGMERQGAVALCSREYPRVEEQIVDLLNKLQTVHDNSAARFSNFPNDGASFDDTIKLMVHDYTTASLHSSQWDIIKDACRKVFGK